MNPILVIWDKKVVSTVNFLPMSVMMGDGNTLIGLDVVGNVGWGSGAGSFACCSVSESCQ